MDAAILVEGNVERLLLPVMIEKEAASLRSACLSILEVGMELFAHKFKSLIEFLGLVALIITDLDSVKLAAVVDDEVTEFEVPNAAANQPPVKKSGTACLPSEPNALTSNQTLIQWLPKKQTIAELLAATEAEKYQQRRRRKRLQGPSDLSSPDERDIQRHNGRPVRTNSGRIFWA